MEELLNRFWTDLAGRLTGPMTFRLILQPLMASLYAVRDGMKDAREGRPPYFWAIFTHPDDRRHLLREGWKATAQVIVLGAVMDLIYQITVFGRVYLLELIVVVMILAFVPYLLVRGPTNRLVRAWRTSRKMPTP